jgi:O-antigen ligase
MTRERLDRWCEKGIVALVIAVLVFGPLATGAVRTLEFLVIQALTLSALLLWLIRVGIKANFRLLLPPVIWLVFAFAIYAIVRYSQAELELVGRRELIRVLVYAILFLVVVNNFSRQEYLQLATASLLIVGMMASIYAIYQFATNSEHVWHFIRPAQYIKRGSGTYICPNHLSGFLEMILPLGISFAITGRMKPLARILVGYASLAIFAGIAVTVSRGGWLATGISLLLLFSFLLRKSQYKIPALLLLLLVIGGGVALYRASPEMQRRVQPTTGTTPDNSAVRFVLSNAAIQMWRNNVWLGVGPGHFDYHFPEFRPLSVQYRAGYVHNDYLNCLADWGLVGFTLVGGAWVLTFVGVFRIWQYVRRDESAVGTRQGNRSAFVLGATVGLIAILIHSTLDFNMQVPANAIVAVALMAMLANCYRFSTDRYWVNPGWLGRIFIILAGSTGIAYLGAQGIQKTREYTCYSRMRRASTVDQKLDALKQAHTVDPLNFETTYAIGESLRRLSWERKPGFETLATEAIVWFERGMKLNPRDTNNLLRKGMCLDLMGRHDEAAQYYTEALKIDPNNYFLQANMGWHYVQVGDYNRAHLWFARSWSANWWDNPIAKSYLAIVERKLLDEAALKK